MHTRTHTHAHSQLAQHSTQLAQAYTCSPTAKVGKKTATTITQLCNYTSQSAHTTTTPFVACCCWLAWKSLAAEAGFWFGKIWSLRLGLEKPEELENPFLEMESLGKDGSA